MTILGKMLVFLVLILSLVWTGLVANSYATRSNWRAEVKKYQDKAVEAAESANNLAKQLQAEQAAAEDAKRILREDRERLVKQIETEKANSAAVQKTLVATQAVQNQNSNKDNQIQANNKSLIDQVDNLTKQLAEKEQTINKLTLDSERSKAEAVQSQLNAENQRRRGDQFYEQLLAAQERMRDLQLGGTNGSKNLLDKRAIAPEGFRGTITTRQGEFVSFTPGLDAGLQPGTKLTVYRLTPSPKYLGKVIVTHIEPKEAVGKFIPPTGVRVSAEDYPKKGDELKPD